MIYNIRAVYNVYIVYIVCILSAPARRGPQLPDGVVKKKTYTGVSNRKSPDSYQHYVVCTALNIRGGLGYLGRVGEGRERLGGGHISDVFC